MRKSFRGENSRIPKFRRFVIQNFPFIEEDFDALTDYGLLCKVVEYLNKVIGSQNDVVAEMNEVLEYFDNLDVQDEVDKKLEEMAEDGTLAEIIAQYLQVSASIAFPNINTMKTAENLVDGSLVLTYGFHSLGDGGGAEYRVRAITNTDVIDDITLFALNDETLVAELNTVSPNVKQLGAYGDGVHDDTTILQYAINNYNDVFIPEGNYLISSELTPKSATTIRGVGYKSHIQISYDYSGTTNYIFKWNNEGYLYRAVFKDLRLSASNKLIYAGGIYIRSSLRGLTIDNITFDDIARPIYLGDRVDAEVNLNNIHANLFPSSSDNFDVTKAIGIELYDANAVNATKIEIVGRFRYGVKIYSAGTASFTDCDVAGSEDIEMVTAFLVEDSYNVAIRDIYCEHCNDPDLGINTHTIEIKDSTFCIVENVLISGGSLWLNGGSNNTVNTIYYAVTSAGIRITNGAKGTINKAAIGYANFQLNRQFFTGSVVVSDLVNESEVNLINNPIFIEGCKVDLARTNASAAISYNTTDYASGDQSVEVTTGEWQGVQHTFSQAVPGQTYTVVARVKPVTNVGQIYLNAVNASAVTTIPNEASHGTGWQYVKMSFIAGETAPVIKLLATAQGTGNIVFLVDAFCVYYGLHDSSISCAQTRQGFLRSNRIYQGYAPAAGGSWNKGDMVFNDFSTTNTQYAWRYDGTAWQGLS